MTHDFDTGGFPVIKLRLLPEYFSLTQRAKPAGANAEPGEDKKETAENKVLRWTRNGFWFLAAGFAGGGLFLTAARAEGWFDPDTSAIVWFIALMLLSAICVAVAQQTINKHVVLAAIRDHTPADVAVLARIATMVARVSSMQSKLAEGLAGMETQRQADLTQIRDNGAKHIEALHDRLDKLAQLIPLAVGEVARKAYAAAVRDLLAVLEAQRRASPDRPDATGGGEAGDQLDAELRGFLAARMFMEEPPPSTDTGPVP